MAVRPWENRFLDINLRDGVMIRENGSAEVKNDVKLQMKPNVKKHALSTIQANLSNKKTGSSPSDGSSSSPGAGVLETTNISSSKTKPKQTRESVGEEVNSRSLTAPRSHSNPKERSTQSDKQKKRMSLPNNGDPSHSACRNKSFAIFLQTACQMHILV